MIEIAAGTWKVKCRLRDCDKQLLPESWKTPSPVTVKCGSLSLFNVGECRIKVHHHRRARCFEPDVLFGFSPTLNVIVAVWQC